MLKLGHFNFKVQHIHGTQNVVADTLSRMFHHDDDAPPDHVPVGEDNPGVTTNASLTEFPLAFTSIATHQRNDEHLSPIIKSLEDGTPSEKFVLSRNVLCIRNKNNHDLRIVAPLFLYP